jgi:uncharacterized protein involved in exopolysaccharide biosynthesis
MFDKLRTVGLLLLIIAAAAAAASSQTNKPAAKPTETPAVDLTPIRSSPAYAELLLHKTELEADLASLIEEYKEDFPKVLEIRVELGFVNSEIARLFNVKPADSGKLTLALGRLMLKKIDLETQLEALKARYKDEHPDVKRLKKQVDIFEAAIKDILG